MSYPPILQKIRTREVLMLMLNKYIGLAWADIISIFDGGQLTPEGQERLHRELGIKPTSQQNPAKISCSRKQNEVRGNETKVVMLDLDGNFIQTFPSVRGAARALGKNSYSPISGCINGNIHNKTAYGYKWMKYSNYVKSIG